MAKRSLNLWVPHDVHRRVWDMKDDGFNPSEFFVDCFEARFKVDVNSLDEENLLSEISALENHLSDRQSVLEEKRIELRALKSERERARAEQSRELELVADALSRARS